MANFSNSGPSGLQFETDKWRWIIQKSVPMERTEKLELYGYNPVDNGIEYEYWGKVVVIDFSDNLGQSIFHARSETKKPASSCRNIFKNSDIDLDGFNATDSYRKK